MTSHDVVARVRRGLGTRKVGHAGTLDPMATGVLVLGVGRATRLLGHLTLTEKAYTATVRLGVATTTDDAEGEVVTAVSAAGLEEAVVRAAFAEQVGDIEQVPSAVSAVKVDGRRAYDRVRAGEEVELAARPVTVHDLTVGALRQGEADAPGAEAPVEVLDVDIAVRCSSGTYIRAIARDVGARLGVGGHLTALRRTAVGPFTLDAACGLDELQVTGIATAARATFPAVDLDDAAAADVRVGRRLALDLDALTAVFDPAGEFLALYEPSGTPGQARAAAVFVG